MQVRVKLLGTLPSAYRQTYPAAGLDLDIPAGATVGDLVDLLGLPRERIGIVTINNILAKADTLIPEHGLVRLMQMLAGG